LKEEELYVLLILHEGKNGRGAATGEDAYLLFAHTFERRWKPMEQGVN
jgi:hypothetical protein